MKRFSTLMLGIALVGLLAGASSQAWAGRTEDMIKAADALDKAFTAAMNRGDAEALAGLYWNDPETVSFMPDAMAKGAAAIRESFVGMFTAMPGAQVELIESHQLPTGDVVLGWGLFKMTVTGPDGQPVVMSGRYTDVKAERDGKWVYLMDHASVPASASVRTD